jgi:NCS1 nucleoside transporter family
MTSTLTDRNAEAALSRYGAKTAAVEPAGVEFIPLDARHGTPVQLFWTWTSPNMEFATIGVGMLGVIYWGLSLWQCFAAILIGTALGSVTHGVLSTWGPESGLCQMVLSRLGFGYLGNILPAGINAVVAGVGWFAVNSISGALALHALIGALPKGVCLLLIVAAELIIAFLGHNLIHAFERYTFPALTVIFVVGCVVVLAKSHPGTAFTAMAPPRLGGFLLMVGAAFGYAAGWNPYAADYTRYLAPDTPKRPVALYAGLGVFLSCILLETAGAAAMSAAAKPAIDPGVYTGLMPTWLGKLTLLCIAVGAVAANALNIYSGGISFIAMGIRIPGHVARAATTVVFGVAGTIVAFLGLKNAGQNYEDFLLVIAYWIAPWLAVVLVDRYLHREGDQSDRRPLLDDHGYRNWAGPIAMLLGMAVSIWLFSNQVKYTGPVPKHHPSFGDITFEIGFVIAAVSYFALVKVLRPSATRRVAPTR